MTKEEAIETLKVVKSEIEWEYPMDYQIALDKAIKALEKEPCEDWYDVPSDEMTLGQARQAVKDLRKKLAEYLWQNPSEDAISREKAIRWVKTECNPYGKPTLDFESGKKVIKHLEQMSSVTPQPKVGKWIYDYITADGHRTYHCSKCGCFLKPKHSEPLNSFKWCSLCGAKMQQESK